MIRIGNSLILREIYKEHADRSAQAIGRGSDILRSSSPLYCAPISQGAATNIDEDPETGYFWPLRSNT